jgi:arsenate reductase (thioredoxin)
MSILHDLDARRSPENDDRWIAKRHDAGQPTDGGAMSNTIDPITQRHVAKAADALVDEFSGVFSRETIERYIGESLELLGSARFSDFLPVLAHRFARERLRALGQSEGSILKELPEVLFVCVQNAARSQMAAGLLSLRSGARVQVRSAGSVPADRINPLVVEAMQELGVDLAEAFPKPLTDEVVRAADVVITMGCGDACPIYPGKRYEDWDLDDPAEAESLEAVRTIRDEIDRRVTTLATELLTPAT